MKKFFTKMLGVCSLLIAFSFTTIDLSAQCPAAPGAGVDAGSACYAQVIANDSFCCNNSWDTICNNAYNACVGGPVSCFTTPPSCVDTNSPAYTTVTSNDPFCCNNSWDRLCQSSYNDLNGSCLCDATPPSCVNILSTAYAEVTANDPFCCATEWDSVCQDTYDALLPGNLCTLDCPDLFGNIGDFCFVPGAPVSGIINSNCECELPTFDCPDLFVNIGDACFTGGPFPGIIDANCACVSTGVCAATPDCVDTNSAAYNNVINSDTFCCNNTWDFICQNAYDFQSGTCDGTEPCSVVPPSCVDSGPFGTAYATVVANDPFCCNTAWDDACQAAYDTLLPGNACTLDCPDLFANIGDACFTGGPFPGVVDANCECVSTGVCAATPDCVDTNSAAYNNVINNDTFCCNNTWDLICQNAYDLESTTCTNPVDCPALGLNIGDACFINGNAGTVNASCNCIETNPCNVDGGTVATTSPRLGLCKGDSQQDLVQLTVSGNVGVGLFGIVRQSDLQVVASNTTGLFNIENLPAGQYFAGHVSVQNLSQLAGITNVNQLSGCFDLSNQLAVTSILLAGGTVSTGGLTTVCSGNVTATVSGNVGPQSRFVLLNQTATTVIAQNQTGVFNFTPLANGIYRIVHISFSNVNLGTITPPVLPACVASSNLVTVTKVACPSAMLESSPNPTSGTSYVSFSVPAEEYTTLEVYDMSGRKVTELFRQVTEADAQYRLEFDGLGLPNGVYIYRLTTGAEVIIEKFMIAK